MKLYLGIITGDSHKRTCTKSIEDNEYNMFRAHGNNIAKLNKLFYNHFLYDIGETYPEFVLESRENLDDIYHVEQATDTSISAVNKNDFLNLKGSKVVILLHVNNNEESFKEYLSSLINDSRLDGIIYYSSDDEVNMRGYLLESLITDSESVLKKEDKSKFLSKLIAAVHGHDYCCAYNLLDNDRRIPDIYLPMVPIEHEELYSFVGSKKEYDFYLDCFTDTRIVSHYAGQISDRTFLVAISETLYKYAPELENVTYVVMKGRNSKLMDLIELASKCRFYLLPNTYAKDEWYRSRYIQPIMYTNKYLVSVYADVPAIIMNDPLSLHWPEGLEYLYANKVVKSSNIRPIINKERKGRLELSEEIRTFLYRKTMVDEYIESAEPDKSGTCYSITPEGKIEEHFFSYHFIPNILAFEDKSDALSVLALSRISLYLPFFGGAISDEEWSDPGIVKYTIIRNCNNIELLETRSSYAFLAFRTLEDRANFLRLNKDIVYNYLKIKE